MNLSGVITQLISLFLMMGTGYLAARCRLLSADFRRQFSQLILSVVSPCIIISAVLESDGQSAAMLSALIVAVFFFLLMIVLAALLTRLVRTPKAERGLDQLLLIFTNLGFMGIPVIQSIYGMAGVAMLSIFILIFNLLFFSYGVLLVSTDRRLHLRKLLNPAIVAALLALFFGLTGLHLPAPIESALASVGAANTPMAMMIIGASLAHSDIRAAFSKPRLYRVCALRLVAMPLIVLAIVRLLPIDPMLAGICVIVAAMPIASNCGMLSDVYTPEDMTASHSIIVSTLLCAVTLPLICSLLAVAL